MIPFMYFSKQQNYRGKKKLLVARGKKSGCVGERGTIS